MKRKLADYETQKERIGMPPIVDYYTCENGG